MITILSFVLVIGVLILIHELGHFLVARWTGVGVERFSIGFGPVLLRCVQALPSHSQVSPSAKPLGSTPPNSTTRPRARSPASACQSRAGGCCDSVRCSQFCPSHDQVSVLPPPPNSSTEPLAGS